MENVLTTPTSLTSSVACEQQKKIIELSLGIQDNVKSIRLLEDTLSSAEILANSIYKEEEQKLREKYDSLTRQCKEGQAEVLNRCNLMILQKKELTMDIADLLKKKKKAKEKVVEKLNQIHKKKKLELAKLREEWKRGEESRRQSFMEKKIKEIRQMTVKGLEPEVKRLVDKHKKDCEQIRKEKELKISEIDTEQKKILQHELICAHSRIEADSRKRHDEARAVWEASVTDLQSQHTRNVANLREQLAKESTVLRMKQIDEHRKIADSHTYELADIHKVRQARLSNIQNSWNNEKEIMKQKFSNEYKTFVHSIDDEKETFLKNLEKELNKQKNANLEKEREKLRRIRDTKIDDLIRRTQAEVIQNQESIQRKLADDLSKTKSFHQKKEKEKREAISKLRTQTADKNLRIQHLKQEEDKWQRLEKQLQDSYKKLNCDLIDVKAEYDTNCKNFDDKMTTLRNDKQHNINIVVKQKAILIEKRKQIEEIKMMRESDNENVLFSTMWEHERKLEEIEALVKKHVEIMEHKIIQNATSSKEQEIRLDYLKSKLAEYTDHTKGEVCM